MVIKDTARQQQWQRIQAITQQMQQDAENNDWQRIADLEQERFSLIQSFFSDGVSKEEAELLSSDINSLLQINAELIEQGTRIKSEVGQALSLIKDQRHAVNAYTQTARNR